MDDEYNVGFEAKPSNAREEAKGNCRRMGVERFGKLTDVDTGLWCVFDPLFEDTRLIVYNSGLAPILVQASSTYIAL